ncbi:MAG TPA: Hsp20/alpha crystallin family protein [Pyrinomonadaceae bacterium]|jgi:HSP20 family protein|nr:Hsp20/alpha crystallin family protein [Pyrinomonadaceae bacterium]
MVKAAHHNTGLERIELERLRARAGRLLAVLQEAAEVDAPHAPGAWLPAVDLCESDDAVTVCVELPGVRAEHIELTLEGTRLRISGRKKKSAPRGVISHLCSERSYGQFVRVVPLRWPIRADGALAELTNGVLVVHLPKLAERRGGGFKITVKENDG